jgi:putative restriction endonuclease
MMTHPERTSLLQRFTRLRVDGDSVLGVAPHKALLLLAVLEIFEQRPPEDGAIALDADIVTRFQNFWPIVAPRRKNRGDIRMPFHALANDRVWDVYDAEGRPSRARPLSVRAVLRPEMREAFADAGFRDELRARLIASYFPVDEQVALRSALGLERQPKSTDLIAYEASSPVQYTASRRLGRSARFRIDVVTSYRFTCALTGYRLTTVDQAGIVEAAHIQAFSKGLIDTPENGLALTPTAHALFDLGLWSATEDLRIVVKPGPVFTESGPPEGFSLRALAGRTLILPAAAGLRPDPRRLSWHRQHHGFG